jgi:iron complex transport system substrate-binding protein
MLVEDSAALARAFPRPPQRVVSLVPSLTESLFDLGLGERLVGVTDYCTRPAEGLAHLPRLGGPKNPQVEQIIALQPDLVLANREENTPQAVRALAEAGLVAWVSFPRTVVESLDVLWTLAGLFQSPPARLGIQALELSLDWATAAAAERLPVRYFCPIWFEEPAGGPSWWMTFNADTYPSDLLARLGGENVFAGRQRRYPLAADLGQAPEQQPGERDTRYPRLTAEEILDASPELILLPDEPFAFNTASRLRLEALLADTPAVKNGRVCSLDGSLITWHGTRLALALRDLPSLLDAGT